MILAFNRDWGVTFPSRPVRGGTGASGFNIGTQGCITRQTAVNAACDI
jgi:hypothetical protein